MTVAMLTVVSKAVSFAKDATIAHRFGTADELDAFMLAFTFLSFGATVLSGGLPEAFLPLYCELKQLGRPRRAHRFALHATGIHAVCLLVTAIAAWQLAPSVITLTTRGFSPEKQALAIGLMQQLVPFLFCFGLACHLAVWLRADKRFAVSSAAPMLIPGGIILSIVLGAPDSGVERLVVGATWGSAAHVLVLGSVIAFQVFRRSEAPRRTLRLVEPAVRTMLLRTGLYLMAGIAFSSAVVVDQSMAAWLESGSVAVLSYTEKICGIILALTAGPACDVLFPYFSEAVARRDWVGLKKQIRQSILWITGVALPPMMVLLALAPWVVGLLFQHGEFTTSDTERVAHVLRFAALQIPFYILGGLLSRVIVSLQTSQFILMMSVATVALNAGLNWMLMWSMGPAGIALSTVLVHLTVSLVAAIYVIRVIRIREARPVEGGNS
jgi:putative peptidoglycan lipid II flippase